MVREVNLGIALLPEQENNNNLFKSVKIEFTTDNKDIMLLGTLYKLD